MLIKAKLENTMSMELAFSSLACQPTRKTNVGLVFMVASWPKRRLRYIEPIHHCNIHTTPVWFEDKISDRNNSPSREESVLMFQSGCVARGSEG